MLTFFQNAHNKIMMLIHPISQLMSENSIDLFFFIYRLPASLLILENKMSLWENGSETMIFYVFFLIPELFQLRYSCQELYTYYHIYQSQTNNEKRSFRPIISFEDTEV